MIIIQVEGGLGNQMFQYALYVFFANRNINTKADISKFKDYKLHNGYELERIFNIKTVYAGKKERAVVKALSKFLRLLRSHPYKEKQRMQWKFQPAVTKIKFGFLKGYWQSEQYFEQVSPIVRQHFAFPAFEDAKNQQMLALILNSHSVSLHIRRGDYLSIDQPAALPLEYYEEAIQLMNASVPGATFFIFSDDIDWARQHIKEKNLHFIDWNTGSESFKDMQLMSLCRHNIIANSSFSWWGAWLNNHADKIVIAPQQWMPGLAAGADIIPKGWVQVPVEYAAPTNKKD